MPQLQQQILLVPYLYTVGLIVVNFSDGGIRGEVEAPMRLGPAMNIKSAAPPPIFHVNLSNSWLGKNNALFNS